MTNKIPKKLMREFKQVVGITGAGSAYWQPELAQVIDLATQWCVANNKALTIHQTGKNRWVVSTGNIHTNKGHGILPRAIMTAVVSAAKGIKDGN